MKETLFRPFVVVSDDGSIAIDWSDSMLETIETDTGAVVEGELRHSELLDRFVAGDIDTPTSLRRLADYIEGDDDERLGGFDSIEHDRYQS